MRQIDLDEKRLTKQHLSTRIYMGYLLYIEKHYPSIDVGKVCNEIGVTIEHLQNPHNWVSVTFDQLFMRRLKELTQNPQLESAAGASSVSKEGLGPLYVMVRHFFTLHQTYWLLSSLSGHMNKVVSIEVTKKKRQMIVMKVRPKYEGLDEEEIVSLNEVFPTIINSMMGYYSALPRIKNLRDAHIDREQSDDLCTFNIHFPIDPLSIFVLASVPIISMITLSLSFMAGLSLIGAVALGLGVAVLGLGAMLFRRHRASARLTDELQDQLNTIRLQNADLQETQRQLKVKFAASQAVNKITAHLIDVGSRQTLLAKIAKELAETLNFDRAFIYIKDQNNQFLELAAAHLHSSDLPDKIRRIKFETSVQSDDPRKIANIYRNKKSVLIENVAAHLPTLNQESQFVLREAGSKSFLAVPIYTAAESYGVLIADNCESDRRLSEEDLATAEVAAKQIGAVLHRVAAEQEATLAHVQTELMARAASKFVPSELVQLLDCESVRDVQLGQNRNFQMAVLFADIRNFTTLAETMTTTEIGTFLNSYYGTIAPVITRNGGIIDKFLGDGLLAVFRGVDEAIAASIQFQLKLEEYNHLHRSGGNRRPIQTGIGIHYDQLLVSVIGYEERLSVTVTSDGVNYASRIDELNKVFKTQILCSSAVADRLTNQDHVRFIAQVSVRGRQAEDKMFEVIGHLPHAERQRRKAAEKWTYAISDALNAGENTRALALLAEARSLFAGDPVFEYYSIEVTPSLRAA